jgi:hypothetical protein
MTILATDTAPTTTTAAKPTTTAFDIRLYVPFSRWLFEFFLHCHY